MYTSNKENTLHLKRPCVCPLSVSWGLLWVEVSCTLVLFLLRNIVCYVVVLHNRYPVSAAG